MRVLFHVDVDVGAEPVRLAKNLTQARADAVGRRLGVEGVEPRGQARQLEGEIDARQRPAVVAVDHRILRLPGDAGARPRIKSRHVC